MAQEHGAEDGDEAPATEEGTRVQSAEPENKVDNIEATVFSYDVPKSI